MSKEFNIQQMKSRITFNSSVMTLHWEENLVTQTNILTDSTAHEMHVTQPDFAYLRSSVHAQYFQERIPLKCLQFLIISRW